MNSKTKGFLKSIIGWKNSNPPQPKIAKTQQTKKSWSQELQQNPSLLQSKRIIVPEGTMK